MFIHAHAVAAYQAILEDRVAVIERPGSLILVAADGAGGRPGGAAAAAGVVRAVQAAAAERLAGPEEWVRFLRSLGRALAGDPEAGETTAVGLTLSAGEIAG